MTIEQGCDALARSLDELLRRARSAKHTVARLRGGECRACCDGQVEASFAELADTVSSALDDVSDRLRRVDGLLAHLGGERPGAVPAAR